MAKKGNDGQDHPKDPAKKDPAKKDPAKRLRKLIKGARVVMLTTVGKDGHPRSRPMLAGAFEGGALWFLTRVPSSKTADVADNQKVNVAYTSPKNERYVSISGAATIVRDAARVKDLWEREHKAWFTGGKNDPELAVMRVQVEHVESWDEKSGCMVPLTGSFEAAAKPTPPAKGPAPVSPGGLG